MKLKPGLKFGNSIVAICFAAAIVNSIYEKHGVECVITSVNDGKHKDDSKHYSDEAFDVRTKNIYTDAIKKRMVQEIKDSLGENFDVILEGEGTANEHLHIEYDPS
jgi:hypothetical protein